MKALPEERERVQRAIKRACLNILVDERGWLARFERKKEGGKRLFYGERICPARVQGKCAIHDDKPLICRLYPVQVYPFYDARYSLKQNGGEPVGFLIGVDANCEHVKLIVANGTLPVEPAQHGQFTYTVSAHDLAVAGYATNLVTLYANVGRAVQTLPNGRIPLVKPSMFLP